MKTYLPLFVLLLTWGFARAQMGVGTKTPDPSAQLEVVSTSRGLLPPRMAQADRDAIVNAATGLIIFNTDVNCLQVNVGTSATPEWICFSSSGPGSITSWGDCENDYPVEGIFTSGAYSFGAKQLGYTGGNGGSYTLEVASRGVTGLTAKASGRLTSGAGSMDLSISGIPDSAGTATFSLDIGGVTCDFTVTVNSDRAEAATLDCSGPLTGYYVEGAAASGTKQLLYSGGNGRPYTIYASSTGVTGLTATGSGTLQRGNGSIALSISGRPSGSGQANFMIALGGASCSFDVVVVSAGAIPDRRYGDGSGHDFVYMPVTSSVTGKVWLNNNLGADYANKNHIEFNPSQQATASNDHHAYGSLYQWGRYSDGHELINWTAGNSGIPVNGLKGTHSSSDTPEHSDFIVNSFLPRDWRSPQKDSLWQGVRGMNNPCPLGFRLPTQAEMNTEFIGAANAADAYNLDQRFPVAGYRSGTFVGVLLYTGDNGYYWTSTVAGTSARYRYLDVSTTKDNISYRINGKSVRCLQD